MQGVFFGELLRSVAGERCIKESAKIFAGKLLEHGKPKRASVGKCLVELKNKIGGDFRLDSHTANEVIIKGCKCPFGDPTGKPELCTVTQTVFTEMSKSCCKGAEVEITESIARGDRQCVIEIHLPD